MSEKKLNFISNRPRSYVFHRNKGYNKTYHRQLRESKVIEREEEKYQALLKPVTTLGTILAPRECNKWSAKKTQFCIAENGIRLLIGTDLFETLGICIKQR